MKIEFEMVKDDLVFKDAIVLPDDHTMSDIEIEAMKKKRFDDWYLFINTPQEDELVQEQPSEE